MTDNSKKQHRRSIRLKSYDYSQAGAYFITICTHKLEPLFGEVVDREMRVNDIGTVVAEEWIRSSEVRQEIVLDEFVVMPNHIHCIVWIVRTNVGATGRSPLQRGPTPKSIGAFVAGFKPAATMRINQMRNTPGTPVWQRNYYEHVIRNEESLNRIREYVINNPLRWHLDRNNPDRTGEDEFDRWLKGDSPL